MERLAIIVTLAALAVAPGCSTLTFRVDAIPASQLSSACFAEIKRDMVPIDVSLLGQSQPDAYRLERGDVIGVYVSGVLPYNEPTQPPELAPVHFPEGDSNRAPSIGVPVVVQDGGLITLPIIGRVDVTGLTMPEASELLKRRYEEAGVLKEDDGVYPVVTLIHPRQTTVLVIREDTGAPQLALDQSYNGGPVKLDAYKNDVLNALMASGGLPGLNAKNEIRIHRRGNPRDDQGYIVLDPNQFPHDGSMMLEQDEFMGGPSTVIPLRVHRGTPVTIRPEDVILNEGDIVYISNRDTEVFYTAGLLPGGEHQMPRDYDIDIFEAMAIAGYSYGNGSGNGGGGGITPSSTGVIPTTLFVFRERPDGTEYTIEIDLERAVACDRERLIVKPGDKLLLRYSCCEETLNFGIFTFFTYGIRQLFD